MAKKVTDNNADKKLVESFDDSNLPHLEISKLNDYFYFGSCEHPLIGTDEFNKLKIDVVINCAAKEVIYSGEMREKYTVIDLRIDDNENATLLEYIDEANEKIDYYWKSNKKIYLHCICGTSRSPAILIYYLMSHQDFCYIDAHELIKEIRPIIDINPLFVSELIQIEEY